jgi:hypothetical protein
MKAAGPSFYYYRSSKAPTMEDVMGAGCGEEAGRRRTSNSMSNSITTDPTEAAVDGGTCQVGRW